MADERRHGSAQEVAGDILKYFLCNPAAADNLEGMARWRLLSETIQRSVQQTSQALEWLVRRGFLLKLDTGGSGPVFCLNLEKRAEAEKLLGDLLDTSPKRRLSED